MSNKKILELLGKLNKALEKLDTTDAKSRAKLSRLIQKIDRKLGAEGSKKQDSLGDELNEAVIHFEIEHPAIAEALNEIKLALHSIGL